MLILRLVLLLALSTVVLACEHEDESPVNFQRAEASLTLGGRERPLDLTPDDTAFLGPADDPRLLHFNLSMRSPDGVYNVALDLEFQEDATQITAFDGAGPNGVTLAVGGGCKGFDGPNDGCRWYSTLFYARDCLATLDEASSKVVAGDLRCGTVGPNCATGLGLRDSTGACTEGDRDQPIEFILVFRADDPLSTKDEAAGTPSRRAP